MGVWDKVERNAMGYSAAAAALGNNQLNAFWMFTMFPSGGVIMAAQTNDIELVDLDSDARLSGFYAKYPYFSKTTIPAGTYRGVDRAVHTFQDNALMVANANVPAGVTYVASKPKEIKPKAPPRFSKPATDTTGPRILITSHGTGTRGVAVLKKQLPFLENRGHRRPGMRR